MHALVLVIEPDDLDDVVYTTLNLKRILEEKEGKDIAEILKDEKLGRGAIMLSALKIAKQIKEAEHAVLKGV